MPDHAATPDTPETPEAPASRDFISEMIAQDIADGAVPESGVFTRFPPEPNGYLHIGHAKAICIVFGMAKQFGGRCNLRMDDTNPTKEEQHYIDAIVRDVQWLGFEWENMCYASDYFGRLYDWARLLIEQGLAYVDDQTPEQMRETRGTLTQPGTPSPYRDRSVEENLDLFARMKAGEFPDGSRVLRAKIDMASPNMVMRDPVMYRILHAEHPRTGGEWCIYPMYDWAHGQSDWIEGITHSLCDLSFEIHRPLYDWFIDRLAELGAYPKGVSHKTRQIEFARGNITYMITSKRKLLRLVDDGHVTGWDDPRMPTISGMRRRGYTPGAIRRFWEEAGIAKRENNIEFAKLESILRDELNKTSVRVMGVIDPLKVTIENWDEDRVDELDAINNPEDESAGSRKVPFTKTVYIEKADFMEDPPRKFFRLGPGREVRLRYAYLLTCTDYVKDENGEVTEIIAKIDPDSRGGNAPDGRKVKGTMHWVSATRGVGAEARLYEHLFTREDPEQVDDESDDFLANLNPNSLEARPRCFVEPFAATLAPETRIQFERLGYFCVDRDSTPENPVFNKTVGLRDTWAKVQKK
ncbi:MAG: glutamine--tRNA ligase/YqeY domain fusion protein [Planctomycetota bacterium]|jgi:glutaminyl-tRNA synthetase